MYAGVVSNVSKFIKQPQNMKEGRANKGPKNAI